MTQRKKPETESKLDPFAVQNPMDVPLFDFDGFEPPAYEPPVIEIPHFSQWPWPSPILVEIIERPLPRWLQVVERVMTKALAHKNAGRTEQFSQVLVPKADFEALKEHFGDEPFLSTCIGLINVYPVNPDGATFVD